MYSHDLNVHCEICAYSRFCETKELKGENNSVLRSLFSLPPTTYWWASSCILGKQWLKRFHRVSAIIWQIYELCWTGSKCPENNRHSARYFIKFSFPLCLVSYTSNAPIDVVEVLFPREKVPEIVSKNKLVRKNSVTIGLVWESFVLGYGLLWWTTSFLKKKF